LPAASDAWPTSVGSTRGGWPSIQTAAPSPVPGPITSAGDEAFDAIDGVSGDSVSGASVGTALATASKSLISCTHASPAPARVCSTDTGHGRLELISRSPSSTPAMATTAPWHGVPAA
jgi:hypothetical protein